MWAHAQSLTAYGRCARALGSDEPPHHTDKAGWISHTTTMPPGGDDEGMKQLQGCVSVIYQSAALGSVDVSHTCRVTLLWVSSRQIKAKLVIGQRQTLP